MPIDSSIYFKQKTPDIAGAVERGYQMRDFMDERAQKKAVSEAYKNNSSVDEKGNFTQNRAGLLSDLGKAGAHKQMADADAGFRAQDLDALKLRKEKSDRLFNIVSSAKDQSSWANALRMAQEDGHDVSKIPQQFDPGLANQYARAAMSAKERADLDWKAEVAKAEKSEKDRNFGLDERKVRVAEKSAGLEEKKLVADAEKKKASGENLPLDAKKQVETLSAKNAGKISIKNQIDAVMKNWDKLSDDQKVTTGRQLLKTLNSTEGADAIGTEEANRLGAKLEFAMGNFTNSNPTQFGRDLPGFKQQVDNVSKSIGEAVKSNQAAIDKSMGRAPQDQAALDAQAVAWALQNPQDPRAAAIIQKNQSSMGSR